MGSQQKLWTEVDGIEAPGGGGDGVSIPKADSYKDKIISFAAACHRLPNLKQILDLPS